MTVEFHIGTTFGVLTNARCIDPAHGIATKTPAAPAGASIEKDRSAHG
jgi:hypothetical protein